MRAALRVLLLFSSDVTLKGRARQGWGRLASHDLAAAPTGTHPLTPLIRANQLEFNEAQVFVVVLPAAGEISGGGC